MTALPFVPLFPGVPGGPELVVILVLGLILFGLPVVLLLGGFAWLRSGDSREERIAELERRIDELERERDSGRGGVTDRTGERSDTPDGQDEESQVR